MAFTEQTGLTYQGSKYAKATFVSTPKIGKTSFLVASALGVLPWQKEGGIVDSPKNLHVVSVDAGSLGGIRDFLLKSCGAPEEALGFTVWNLQDSARRVGESAQEYDLTFFGDLMAVFNKIQERTKGVPVVHIASLTGVSQALERSVVGPPGSAGRRGQDGKVIGKGYGDISKWQALGHQLSTIQNTFQVDDWHCLWETHLDQGAPQMTDNAPEPKQSIKVSGSAGRWWAFNCESVFSIKREFGQRYKETTVDKVYLDTKHGIEVLSGGRKFNEVLDPQERDMTATFRKLGLKVGHWNQREKKQK
jgi:hypothetical protein